MSLRLPPIHPKTKSRLIYDLPSPKRKRLPKIQTYRKVKIYNYSKIMKMNKISHLNDRYYLSTLAQVETSNQRLVRFRQL